MPKLSGWWSTHPTLLSLAVLGRGTRTAMDRGIAGWDVDSIASWRNLNVEAVRTLTDYVKARGGFITSENVAFEHDI